MHFYLIYAYFFRFFSYIFIFLNIFLFVCQFSFLTPKEYEILIKIFCFSLFALVFLFIYSVLNFLFPVVVQVLSFPELFSFGGNFCFYFLRGNENNRKVRPNVMLKLKILKKIYILSRIYTYFHFFQYILVIIVIIIFVVIVVKCKCVLNFLFSVVFMPLKSCHKLFVYSFLFHKQSEKYMNISLTNTYA